MTDPLSVDEKSKHRGTARWKTVRLAAKKRDRNRCRLCNASPKTSKVKLEVHHSSYATVNTAQEILDVITLCEPCHRGVEQMLAERKRIEQANNRTIFRATRDDDPILKHIGWTEDQLEAVHSSRR